MFYGYSSGGLFLLFPLIFIGFWCLFFVFAFRRHPHGHYPYWDASASAAAILKERFARGEIDENEYKEKLRLIQGQ